jgi:hypothetical protein
VTVVIQTDERFELLNDDAKARWWQGVRAIARATLMMESGTRIFVSESLGLLARSSRRLAFLEVHVVSTATGSPYEFYRTVHAPALRRLIPVGKVTSIAPVVDAETLEKVPA